MSGTGSAAAAADDDDDAAVALLLLLLLWTAATGLADDETGLVRCRGLCFPAAECAGEEDSGVAADELCAGFL